MKKFLLSTILPAMVILLLAGFGGGNGSKYPGGAPAGYTGSPFDGKDCSASSCHGGTSATVTGWITSNVPASGYSPGLAYTITVTVPGTGTEKKGFEVSAQKTDGTLLGTLMAGTGSKLVGAGNGYITHSAAIQTSPAVWTFTWMAPAAGTGPVTFYGAFVADFPHVFHSIMTVQENNVGVNTIEPGSGFVIFPNPVKDKLSFTWNLHQAGHVVISLYDLTGKPVTTLMDEDQNAGLLKGSFELANRVNPGIYLLKYSSDNAGARVEKIIVN